MKNVLENGRFLCVIKMITYLNTIKMMIFSKWLYDQNDHLNMIKMFIWTRSKWLFDHDQNDYLNCDQNDHVNKVIIWSNWSIELWSKWSYLQSDFMIKMIIWTWSKWSFEHDQNDHLNCDQNDHIFKVILIVFKWSIWSYNHLVNIIILITCSNEHFDNVFWRILHSYIIIHRLQ